MKITAFSGSPRKKSNSGSMLDYFLKGAELKGGEYTLYNTDDLEIAQTIARAIAPARRSSP